MGEEAKQEVKSRGWVDDAIDEIAKGEAKGVSLDALPHDVQQTIASMKERAEGKRALGTSAHELDHVKHARKYVAGRLAQIRAGEG